MGLGNDATTLGYFPNKLTVKAGTTVTFVNKAPKEPHNITFGPKKYIQELQKKTDLLPQGPPARRTRSRRSCSYGSEPKGGYKYDGTNHGNGFFATPVTIGAGPRAAAALVDGHVHEARQVQVLLLDPRARHGGRDRRHGLTAREGSTS